MVIAGTEVILLDYAGVITANYVETDYPAELARKFGIGTGAFISTNQQNQLMARLCLGEISEEDVSRTIVEQNPGARSLQPAEFVTEHYDPDPEILDTLSRIRSNKTARLVLVSNIFPASISYLLERGVNHYFDRVFFSCEMGDRKPEHTFFNAILASCDAEPETCLFLDDTPANIEAAKQMRIPSELITDRQQVLDILKGLSNA